MTMCASVPMKEQSQARSDERQAVLGTNLAQDKHNGDGLLSTRREIRVNERLDLSDCYIQGLGSARTTLSSL
jgi:hypothetical protein